MQSELCKVAIVQHPPVFMNLGASLDRAADLLLQAGINGARLVVFPETWLPGYPVWLDSAPNAALWDYAPARAVYRLLVENSLTIPGPEFGQLQNMAYQTGVYLVMGLHERQGGTLYNTMLYLAPDKQTFALHRKLVPTYTERLVWGRGDGSTINILSTEYGTVGGLICWEHWMPLARAAMHARSETIHVAQWPAVNELHQLASRHYAFEGSCFVLAAGTVLSRSDVLAGVESLNERLPEAMDLLESIPGNDETLLQRGGSAIIGPDGQYIAGPLFDEPAILYADIDPGRMAESHLTIDTAGHYARPDVFRLEVNERPQENVVFRKPDIDNRL